jgi:hypothetical protein
MCKPHSVNANNTEGCKSKKQVIIETLVIGWISAIFLYYYRDLVMHMARKIVTILFVSR